MNMPRYTRVHKSLKWTKAKLLSKSEFIKTKVNIYTSYEEAKDLWDNYVERLSLDPCRITEQKVLFEMGAGDEEADGKPINFK